MKTARNHAWSTRSRARQKRRFASFRLIAATVVALVVSAGLSGTAQANTLPDQPLVCFMVQGSPNRVLTFAPPSNDGATEYDVSTNYVAATGAFTPVATITVGNSLNLNVGSGAHWVRSSNATGDSDWLRCDSYRKISFVDVNTLTDVRRSGVDVAVGLDGNGSSPTGTENGTTFRTFGGDDDDVVVMDVDGAAGLAPDNKKMAWRVRFRLTESDLQTLEDAGAGELSWNIMQRGLADDSGGQWKMSIVSQADDSVRVQCVTQTAPGASNRLQVDSAFDISTMSIVNGMTPWITATCFSDDSGQSQGNGVTGDGIQVVVNGVTSAEVVGTNTGTIDPAATGTCNGNNSPFSLSTTLFPDGIGGVVTVGNKPACWNPNDADDRFQGDVDYAEVFKQ